MDLLETGTGVFVGQPPWHKKGVLVTDALTWEDAARLGNLTKKRHKEPLYWMAKDGTYLQVPDHMAVVRDDEVCNGVVGMGYEVIQDEEMFKFLNSLAGEGKIKFHTAGSLKDGKLTWVMARFGESFEPVKGDVVDKNLLFLGSHDGSVLDKYLKTFVRVVCWNTLMNALADDGKTSITFKHTRNVHDRMAKTQDMLARAYLQGVKCEEFVRWTAKMNVTDAMAQAFVRQLFPVGESGALSTKTKNNREKVLELAVSGKGQDIVGVRGTAWGLLNGVTEYVNFHRGTRGAGEDAGAQQEKRFESMVVGSGGKLVQKAVEILVPLLAAA